jgi:threonine dehydratase
LNPVGPIPLEEIRGAAERIRGSAVRTPTVRLNADSGPEISLKLENLQPIGSFKIRGASNAMLLAPKASLAKGVYTASAGNMAQGVAYSARRLGVPCTVIVPDHAPEAKLAAISRLGGRVEKLPFDRWWQVLVDHGVPGREEFFVHPVSDPAVIAGNGTIGLEILEDVPDADTILVPYGGGGSPRKIQYTPSFVDGIGAGSVLAEMWPLVRSLLSGSIVSPVSEIAAAVKLLAERNRVVAEGAAGAAVAAALSGKVPGKKIVCVVSGGNIDSAKLAKILNGEVP